MQASVSLAKPCAVCSWVWLSECIVIQTISTAANVGTIYGSHYGGHYVTLTPRSHVYVHSIMNQGTNRDILPYIRYTHRNYYLLCICMILLEYVNEFQVNACIV